MNSHTIFALSACLFMTAGAAADDSQPAAPLAPLYVDSLNGYSIRPPADTEQRRQFSSSRLVSWSKRDPKTQAIIWTLSVSCYTSKQPIPDMSLFAKQLPQLLLARENFVPQSIDVVTAAGKPAISVKGEGGGNLKLWQQQVWVSSQPNGMLIFTVSGPGEMNSQLESILQSVLTSAQFTDPKAEQLLRAENITRSKALLASLSADKIRSVLNAEPRWYLLKWQGKYVGFQKEQEGVERIQRRSRKSGSDGKERLSEDSEVFAVKTVLYVALQPDQPVVLRREMFLQTDLKMDRWWQLRQIVSGGDTTPVFEEGIRQGNMIICSSGTQQHARSHTKKVPAPIYLPQVIGYILPRLLDINGELGYGFACYNSELNDFDMRTVRILGRDTVTLGGKSYNAIHASDQQAYDKPAATIWLDGKGDLLKMQTSEGLEMEFTTQQQVLENFPKAQDIIDSANRWKHDFSPMN